MMKKTLLLLTLLASTIFVKANYTLTLYAKGCDIPNSFVLLHGQQVKIIAEEIDGFHFVQWSDGNTDNPRQLTMTADTELVALFELADGLEQLMVDDAQCTMKKMITDNQLYIFRGDKIYNAAGVLMK